jgi:hypothetical protein
VKREGHGAQGQKVKGKREKGKQWEMSTAKLVLCPRNGFTHSVIPDLIRNPVFSIWIPAFAGMTTFYDFIKYPVTSNQYRLLAIGICSGFRAQCH